MNSAERSVMERVFQEQPRACARPRERRTGRAGLGSLGFLRFRPASLLLPLGRCARARGEVAPAGDLLSCSCKKGGKEHGPNCARPCAFGFRVPCAAQNPGARAELAAFATLTPLKQAARVRSRIAPAARAPGFLRCSAAQRGGTQQPNSQQPNLGFRTSLAGSPTRAKGKT